jgi:hypothetical protein
MRSNFEFLAENWNDLYEIAKSAEKSVLTEPNTTLIKLRLYGELITKYLFTNEKLNESYRMNQKERIDFLLKKGFISDEIFNILDTLRIKGNKAVQEANYGPLMETKRLLRIAFYFGGWFNQLYGQWDYDLPEYKEPQPILKKLININSKTAEKSVGTTTNRIPVNLPTGIIMTFSNNDTDYEKWLQENRIGFVFNYFGGMDASKEMNKIHRANCRFLHRKQVE